MGYYMSVDEGGFTILGENLDAAFQALVDFNEDKMKRTGFVPEDDLVLDSGVVVVPNGVIKFLPADFGTRYSGLGETLTEAGFEVDMVGDNLNVYGYDAKSGDEMDILTVLAPFVVSGGYLVWSGENPADGLRRDDFVDGEYRNEYFYADDDDDDDDDDDVFGEGYDWGEYDDTGRASEYRGLGDIFDIRF